MSIENSRASQGATASCLPREAGGGPPDEARLISIGGGLAGRCSDNTSSPAESGPAQEAAKRAGQFPSPLPEPERAGAELTRT